MFEKTLKYINEAYTREKLRVMLLKKDIANANGNEELIADLDDKMMEAEFRLQEIQSIIDHFANHKKKK